ncbi:T9SS type A sorting domain-containing protein [Psychroserpens sp. MEBiC05023]
MKKIITLFVILIVSAPLVAQNVTYDLRWNSNSSLYELYITRDVTAVAPVTTGGTSTVTIVFPTDGVSGTRTVSHTSESVSTYNAAGVIRSPNASSSNDYYVFNSTGGASYIGVLNAGIEVLWMTFTASDGNSEARLFENNSDPNSTDSGMMGINARSEFFTITTAGSNDEFSENVLNVETNELLELSIYPNPTSDKVSIISNSEINTIEVYNLLGKKLKTLKQTNEVYVSDLNTGMYLLMIYSIKGHTTKKIIKE